MARPGSTTSETGNNYQSANGTGAAVRAKLNEIFQALRTISSGSSDPSGAANIAQFQPHINTSTNELKIATAVSGDTATYVVLGKINEANFGHAALTGATFTGKVIHNYNSSLTIPTGTTAQRDGTPAVGMFRHNSTLNQFEGYNNGAWGAIGGGAGATGGGTDEVFFESDQAATTSYSISAGKNAHTVSPTINSGVSITVPSGATLVIL